MLAKPAAESCSYPSKGNLMLSLGSHDTTLVLEQVHLRIAGSLSQQAMREAISREETQLNIGEAEP